MKHHMMMRLFLGNLLPAGTMRDLLRDYRDRMADWAASLREAHAKFTGSLAGPYRASVFFELLSLEHLIAQADLEVSGTTTALEALARFPEAARQDGSEQPRPLIDGIPRRP